MPSMPTRVHARKPTPVLPITTNLMMAATWLRVLGALDATPIDGPDGARSRRAIVTVALSSVEAWGKPDMIRRARRLAKKVLRSVDDAAVSAPVVDLAAYRARRAS